MFCVSIPSLSSRFLDLFGKIGKKGFRDNSSLIIRLCKTVLKQISFSAIHSFADWFKFSVKTENSGDLRKCTLPESKCPKITKISKAFRLETLILEEAVAEKISSVFDAAFFGECIFDAEFFRECVFDAAFFDECVYRSQPTCRCRSSKFLAIVRKRSKPVCQQVRSHLHLRHIFDLHQRCSFSYVWKYYTSRRIFNLTIYCIHRITSFQCIPTLNYHFSMYSFIELRI